MIKYQDEYITQYEGDCIEILPSLKENTIDLILTDPPYGTTKCKWDSVIPFEEMWGQLKRVRKDTTPTLLFSQTPFDKVLGVSNIEELKYEWIWEKTQATGHLNSKKMPMKAHENILVFYKKLPLYNPIKTQGHERKVSSSKNRAECIRRRNQKEDYLYGKEYAEIVNGYDSTERFPRDVLKFSTDKQKSAIHPTQKPVDLLKYFITTYTNEGDTVLDFSSGSGSTAIACRDLKRKCICIEKESKWIQESIKRFNKCTSI